MLRSFALALGFMVVVCGCANDTDEEATPTSATPPPAVATPTPDYHPPAITETIIGEIDEARAIDLARNYLDTWGKDTSLFNLHETPSVKKVESGQHSQWVVSWEAVREPRIHDGVEVIVSSSGIGASYID